MRNLPGLHAAVRLAASLPLVTSLDEYVVPGASHTTVTSHARPGRQLLVVQQVTARRTVRDKAKTSFAIHHLADLRPADGDTCRTEFERVARPRRLAHLLDSPCLSLNAQQGIRFSGASSYIRFRR